VLHNRCECGGTLLVRYDLTSAVDLTRVRERPGGMWRYRELLPLEGDPLSLGETETPLIFLPRISERLGVETYLKDEAPLPSGTFKARGAAVALSRLLELGVESVVMPSAGNAGGAWALYAARAGVPITVTMARTAPVMNQIETRLAGAELILVDGSIADAGAKAKEIAAATGAYLASTFNEPYRVEGKKTAWLEVFDALGRATGSGKMSMPGSIVTSVGGGVAAVAASKAAAEVTALGWTDDPVLQIVGVQAADCAPVVRAFEAGADETEPWAEMPVTIAAGLRVPAPSEGYLVLRSVRSSDGAMATVTEDEIRAAIATLASTEGLLVCPEGATTLVAAERLAATLRPPVVLYNTGAGIKYLGMLGS
jgi:threonine synthase